MPTIILTATILSLFAVFAAAWSKTSFALTLIRLVDSWMKKLLWTVVVAMNIVMNLVIVFSFVKCTPVGKVWDSSIPGTCWDPYVTTYYNIFAGGEIFPHSELFCVDCSLTTMSSVLWAYRRLALYPIMAYYMETLYADTGENWHWDCLDFWYFVCVFLASTLFFC